MSTTTYLDQLDLGQLKFARDKANELIARKESPPMRVVWCVEDSFVTIESFGDYIEAAEKLMEVAKSNAAAPIPLKSNNMELHLVSRKVPESEYSEWVKCR